MDYSDVLARVRRACGSWPAHQQARWIDLMAPILGEAPWKPVTQAQNAGVYTRFLAAGHRLSPDGVRSWIRELEHSGVATRTIAGYLRSLHKVARKVIGGDLGWLVTACQRIEAVAKRTRKRRAAYIAPAAAIYQFAFEAIARAKGMEPESWAATQLFRDGLFLAYGLCAPERLRALVSTRLNDLDLLTFRAAYSADVIKTGKASIRTYPAIVGALLEEWIALWRAKHVDAAGDHHHLWIAKGGGPAVAATMYAAMRRLTAAAPWGYAITPHLLRNAAATACVEASPQAARLAPLLLGHASERMTRHYTETAKRIEATRQGRSLIAAGRESAGRRAREVSESRGTLLSHPAARARRRQASI